MLAAVRPQLHRARRSQILRLYANIDVSGHGVEGC